MTFKKELKKLTKAYGKQLDYFNKKNKEAYFVDLNYFITYLQLMRDKFALINTNNEINNLKLATIATAIDEYKKYLTCIYKYFNFNGSSINKVIDGTDEEILALYNKEKQKHWDNFCDLFKENYPFWNEEFAYYDSNNMEGN